MFILSFHHMDLVMETNMEFVVMDVNLILYSVQVCVIVYRCLCHYPLSTLVQFMFIVGSHLCCRQMYVCM